MLVAARTGAWAKSGAPLPYDEEVEYLESTGTQWIDSLCKNTETLEFRVKLDNSKMTNRSQSFGYFGTLGIWGNLFGTYRNNKSPIIWVRPTWRYVGRQLGMIEAYCGLNSITINGVVCEKEQDKGNTYGGNIEIFRGKDGCSEIKMYSMQIYDKGVSADGTLVRDFIPVRVGDVGYLYDRLSGQLFGNSGTGEFIIGPDKTT